MKPIPPFLLERIERLLSASEERRLAAQDEAFLRDLASRGRERSPVTALETARAEAIVAAATKRSEGT